MGRNMKNVKLLLKDDTIRDENRGARLYAAGVIVALIIAVLAGLHYFGII